MSTTRCVRCQKNEARKHNIFGLLPCFQCISEDREKRKANRSPEFYSATQQTRVQNQRDEHEGDMVQPYDRNGNPSEEFARLFPDKAKELFGEYERVTGKETELAK